MPALLKRGVQSASLFTFASALMGTLNHAQQPSDSSGGTAFPQKKPELNVLQRIVSASGGAIVTSLLVTPLDVVKTRLQAQQQQLECVSEAHTPVECRRCTHFNFHNGLMDVMLPKSMMVPIHKTPADCPYHLNGTFDALIKIYRHEGIASLYNGLRPSLIMAVPSTVLYFASYDKLKDVLVDRYGFGSLLAPLFAGTIARTLAATAIAPLELVRTNLMAMTNPPSMLHVARDHVRMNGLRSLWGGLSPTLLRDVPFSAIYWVAVERSGDWFRSRIIARQPNCSGFGTNHGGALEEFCVSFLAGATGGVVAAAFTHPFDVIKTRAQIIQYAPDASGSLTSDRSNQVIIRRILRQEGMAGFFVGLAPRLGKIMPACAIMLSSYNLGKQLFLEID